MRILLPILLLVVSNTFMTLAWYGHLKFANWSFMQKSGMFGLILVSWGIAFFEYCFQVPANRLGYTENGGPFNVWQLKVIQEVITLVVFAVFALLVFKNETFRWNHALAFVLVVVAVWLVFKK
jgi:uncharacterized protein (DUF486 family)